MLGNILSIEDSKSECSVWRNHTDEKTQLEKISQTQTRAGGWGGQFSQRGDGRRENLDQVSSAKLHWYRNTW